MIDAMHMTLTISRRRTPLPQPGETCIDDD